MLLRNKRPKRSRRLSARLSWSWRWVHTYVWMYVCMYVCTYVCMYVCTICVSVCTQCTVCSSVTPHVQVSRDSHHSNTVPHLLTASEYRPHVHTYVCTCHVHIPCASLIYTCTDLGAGEEAALSTVDQQFDRNAEKGRSICCYENCLEVHTYTCIYLTNH